jgi:mRNA deadenylase 3'-5' endonuclease subunit Ccr4
LEIENTKAKLWQLMQETSHPQYTMYAKGADANFDYIFYSPSSMQVEEILRMPTFEEISKENNLLPNSSFPSDHLRLETKFSVFYE